MHNNSIRATLSSTKSKSLFFTYFFFRLFVFYNTFCFSFFSLQNKVLMKLCALSISMWLWTGASIIKCTYGPNHSQSPKILIIEQENFPVQRMESRSQWCGLWWWWLIWWVVLFCCCCCWFGCCCCCICIFTWFELRSRRKRWTPPSADCCRFHSCSEYKLPSASRKF